MAIINDSGSAVTLTDSGNIIDGTVTGIAPAYAGFYAAIFGPGNTNYEVVVTGTVEATGNTRLDAGIVLGSPGEVFNDNVIDGGAGVFIAGTSSGAYIRNIGLIEATQGDGVVTDGEGGLANIGTVLADGIGVNLRGGGELYNAGSITGLIGAVISTYYGSGSIYNVHLIRGTLGDGAILAGTLTNLACGTIVGAQNGLYLYTQGSASNAGLIAGGSNGILVGGGGIVHSLSTDIVNTGIIEGNTAGIAISSPETAAVNIYNDAGGTIVGAVGIDIVSGVGPVIKICNSGLIEGGISFQYGVIVNTSSIFGTTAVYLDSGYLLNGNRLVGDNIGVVSGGVTVENSTADGVVEQSTLEGSIILSNHGYISGEQKAIVLLNGGVIGNCGEINSSYGTAIESDGAGLRLTNVGRISAAKTAVQGAGDAYVVNTSNILAGSDAISLSGTGSIYNVGYIDSRTANGLILGQGGSIGNGGAIFAGGGTAIDSNSGLILVNTGKISGGVTAIQVAGSAYMFNSFNISAAADAISVVGNLSLHNVGLIQSSTAIAVHAGTGAIYNAGIIKGATGVSLNTTGTIINAVTGTIVGTTAVVLSGGEVFDNAGRVFGGIEALTGSTINNTGVIATGGVSATSLYGIVIGSGSIKLSNGPVVIGGKVGSGQRINFGSGAETLSLSNPTYFAASLDNFSVMDTIDLSGVVPASIISSAFVGGILTLTEAAGSITLTFANPSTLMGDSFVLSADGSGTGINLVAAPQMTFVTHPSAAELIFDETVTPSPITMYTVASTAPLASVVSVPGRLLDHLLTPPPFDIPLTFQS